MIVWQGESLEQVEREVLLQALTQLSGHRANVALQLGICTRTLANKMRRYPELRFAGKGADE